jgi:phage-related minor tail protein
MVDEVVNIEVREDGSRAVASNWNALADAGDKAGDVSEALQKIMQGVQTTMDKLNTTIDKLNSNLAKQSSAVAQATQAATASTKATDNLNSSVSKLGESEADATNRIKEMVQASLAQVAAQDTATAAATAATAATQAQAAATLQASEAAAASASGYTASASAMVQQMLAVEQFNNTLSGGIKNISQWRDVEGQLVAAVGAGTISMKEFQQMTAQLDAQLPNLTASINKEAAGVASLIGKYDPLSAKAAQLSKDELALQAARNNGIISIQAYESAMAGLVAEQAALAKAQEEAAAAGTANAAVMGLNARATRELGTVVEDVATGNIGRLKTSLGALANSSGLLAKAFSPLGLTILGLVAIFAALTAGIIKGYEAFQQLNRDMIITGDTSGVTSGQILQLSQSMATVNVNAEQTQELLTGLVGTGRATSESFSTIGKAAQNMLALTGSSVQEVVNDFSKLYDDPVKWADDMDTKWHFLTSDVRDHAKQLQDVGDKYGAAQVIAGAFADNTKTKIDQLNESMGTLAKLIQQWQNGVANIKGAIMDIGVPDSTTQQFVKARDAYSSFMADMKRQNGDQQLANGDLYVANTLYQRMYDLQQKVIAERAGTQAAEQADQQRQSVLKAGEAIDSVNDKTQKQITLQNKLTELRTSYQKLYFLNPSDPRLAGVNFDTSGNPSGGSYQSKVDELTQKADGKPKKPKVDNSAFKEWEQYYNELMKITSQADPVQAALDKMTEAQKILNQAVQMGDLTQEQATRDLAVYKAQLAEAADPLGTLTKKLDDQLASMKGTAQQSKADQELQKQTQDLLKQGIVLTDEQTAALLKKDQAIQSGLANQALEEKVLKSITNATRDQITELEQLNKLKDAGSLSQDQINQYEYKKNPQTFQGTQFGQDQQLKAQQDQLALIKQLNKEKVLNDQDTNTAIMNNQLQTQKIQLQGTQTFLGTMATLMTSHNKTQFEIGKAAAIAQAGINTYLSATEAFASLAGIPIVGPILGGIAAAAAVAAGLAQINQIRSQQMQGFEVGGYTGNLPTGAVAGVVHGQEWVSNAATTARYRPQLEAMHNGTFNPDGQANQQQPVVVQAPQAPDVRAIFVDDQRDVGNYLNSDKGEKIIVSTVNKNNGKR